MELFTSSRWIEAMQLVGYSQGVEIREFAWKFSVFRFAIAAGIVFWFYQQHRGLEFMVWPGGDGFGWVAFAGLLMVWGYYGLLWRSWRFDTVGSELQVGERKLFTSSVKRIPFREFRRVIASTSGSGKGAYLVLIHAGGALWYRNYTSSTELESVREVAARLQEKFNLHESRFADDDIIREVKHNNGAMAALRVVRQLKRLSLRESRDYVRKLA